MEDKQKILDLLLPALQATRNLSDLVELEYREDRELVYAKFASGNQKIVNVAMDSGTALIRGRLYKNECSQKPGKAGALGKSTNYIIRK